MASDEVAQGLERDPAELEVAARISGRRETQSTARLDPERPQDLVEARRPVVGERVEPGQEQLARPGVEIAGQDLRQRRSRLTGIGGRPAREGRGPGGAVGQPPADEHLPRGVHARLF